MSGTLTKKEILTPMTDVLEDDLRPEYDFSTMQGGVRGKYYRALQEGYSIRIHEADGSTEVRHYPPGEETVVLEPDVRQYFPTSAAVNDALRSLIRIAQEISSAT